MVVQGRATVGILALLAAVSGPALAHPHVFIDTTVTAILDAEGQLSAIRLRWDYDSLLSLVVIEDKGADVDMDGAISADESGALDGFDMTWVEGFDGDTSLFLDDTLLPLVPGPQDWATGWSADDSGGHLWSEHTRKLVAPVDPGAGRVRVVVYDVSDYTAYALTEAAPGQDAPKDALSACRTLPPVAEAGETDGGLLATVGLFLTGGGDGAEVSVVPAPAAGRVVAVLDCD